MLITYYTLEIFQLHIVVFTTREFMLHGSVSCISLYYAYSDVLHIDKHNADALYIRGMCLYFQDDIDRAFTHFQQVLRLAPDHVKALEIYKVRD